MTPEKFVLSELRDDYCQWRCSRRGRWWVTLKVAVSNPPGTVFEDQLAGVSQLLSTGLAIQVPLPASETLAEPRKRRAQRHNVRIELTE